jgi:exopolysaccharide biosynthesis WecB/TagA/CpsF family protein
MLEEKSWVLRALKTPFYFFNLFFNKQKLYEKYGDRICWSDITKDLLYYCETQQISITIVDLYIPTDLNKVASQEIFTEKLSKTFPELKFDYIIYNPEKKPEILEQIKNSNSKVLFSTLWMKRQEQSVIEIMEYCDNIKLGLWIGSSFDYFTGFQKRSPQIFSTLWIEWFYRIFTWPQKIKRLKRVYNAIFVFLYRVLKQK